VVSGGGGESWLETRRGKRVRGAGVFSGRVRESVGRDVASPCGGTGVDLRFAVESFVDDDVCKS
jgi:hypothetical protein